MVISHGRSQRKNHGHGHGHGHDHDNGHGHGNVCMYEGVTRGLLGGKLGS